jgi:dipeptidyl aminopeptidase/acylaminoacyl peptidase
MDRRDFLQAGMVTVAVAALPMYEVAPALADSRRGMTTDDILEVEQPQNLRLSPTGSIVLFGRQRLSADQKTIESSLWLLNVAKLRERPHALTDWGSDKQGVFSPDGTVVAFLRQIDGKAQLFTIPSGGGDARLLAKLDHGISHFAWSPDGRSLALSGPTRFANTPEKDADLAEGVHIFTHANYRFEGRGYVDFDQPEQIWVLAYDPNAANLTPRQLTHGRFAAEGMSWSIDSQSLLFTCDETDEPYYGRITPTLYQVIVATGERQTVAPMNIGSTSYITPATKLFPSPDGCRIAYVANNPAGRPNFAQGALFILDKGGGTAKNLTATYDPDISGGNNPGSSGALAWLDNNRILAMVQWHGTVNLVMFDTKSGKATPWTEGRQVVRDFVASSDGRTIIAVITDPVRPAELFDVSRAKRQVRLTGLNDALLERAALDMPESFWFTGSGDEQIQGFLYRPPNFDPHRTYPMVLSIHGGPYYFNNESFYDDAQIMAGAGYLYLLINPRGSMSYGQAFASALPDWPGGNDIDDLMAGVDFIAGRPYVDKSKLGVSGGSAGAVAVDWIIGHTNRFAAAVSTSDIADFRELWYIGDQPSFGENKAPFQQTDENKRSPIYYAGNIKTPTMFIGGDRDYRTPASSGGLMMFRALKDLRVPTALIWFEGAGHSIGTSSNPKHRAMRSRHMLRWFDHYLKGLPTPEYDLVPKEF